MYLLRILTVRIKDAQFVGSSQEVLKPESIAKLDIFNPEVTCVIKCFLISCFLKEIRKVLYVFQILSCDSTNTYRLVGPTKK